MTEHVRADADAIVIRGEDGIRASEVVVGAATDVGRLRTINEDGYLAIAPAFVVVDGMGGHAAGRMATQGAPGPRQWDQGALDRVWITDLTYLRCAQGWVYLCAVRDAHSRRVLGYAMGEQQSTDLVITALDMAATTRGGFPTGVVLHADRGTQFTSGKLAAYMRAVKGRVSMGRAGVCWDNAMAESFWATLKTEYYYRRTFTTRDQVYTGVATWIEDFYNRRRIHTSLGGKSPIEYELHQAAWTTAA